MKNYREQTRKYMLWLGAFFLFLGTLLYIYHQAQTTKKTKSSQQELSSKNLSSPKSTFSTPSNKPHENKWRLEIQSLFKLKKYEETLKLIQKKIQGPHLTVPMKKWLLKQRSTAQIALGWQAIHNLDWNLALIYFTKAESQGKDRYNQLGLAYVFFQKKQWQESEGHLRWLVDNHMIDDQTLRLYVDLLEKQQKYNVALDLIQKHEDKLRAEDKKNLRLQKNRLKIKKKAQQDHTTIESTNFVLNYHPRDHHSIAETVLDHAEQHLLFFISQYGFQEPYRKIPIVLYSPNHAGPFSSHSPAWADGMFDGAIHLPTMDPEVALEGTDPLTTILSHELVHALFDQELLSKNIPPWVHEGMAQKLTCERIGCPPYELQPSLGSFLQKKYFLESFRSLQSIKAKKLYAQSRYLIDTIEYLKGPNSLRILITSMSDLAQNDSDGWLHPLDISFQTLYETARARWDRDREAPTSKDTL